MTAPSTASTPNLRASAAFNCCALIASSVEAAGLKAGAKLVVAYSGGVDSEILAHGLAEFAVLHPQFHYLLLHVHHGLSSNAETWVAHCQARASAYGLPIEIKRVQVKTGARLSIEAEARSARYSAIKSVMLPGDALLTGHHLDDQLETVLLALKRGLGPKGLAAMGAIQNFDTDKQLLRPLLSIEREQIEAHAAQLNLTHITDESNDDTRYDRNFLRLDIIPRLKARWGAIATTASRSAALCAQQQAVIDDELAQRLPCLLVDVPYGVGVALDLSLLKDQSTNWQALLFRGFLEYTNFAPPSQIQLTQILTQLMDAKVDAKVEIRLGDLLIRRYQDKAYLASVKQECAECAELKCHDISSLDSLTLNLASLCHSIDREFAPDGVSFPLSSTKTLHVGKQIHQARIRLPNEGEWVSIRYGAVGSTRCHPHNRDQGRELKKLWQEYGIPPWERAKVPLIFYNQRLVCALGIWIEKSYLSTDDQPGLVFSLK